MPGASSQEDGAIKVEGLTKQFGQLVAVDHVGFQVRQGEFFGFLGPNGAGKTTTMRMLTGIIGKDGGSATFVGYLAGSWPGALLATLGIFLPSFVFVAVLSRFMPWARKSPWARTFLDGVNVASLGLMAGVTWELGRAGIVDMFTIVLAVVSLVLVFRFKVNSVWLVLGGGVLGILYKMLIGSSCRQALVPRRLRHPDFLLCPV